MKKSVFGAVVVLAVFFLGVWLGAEAQLQSAGFKKWGSTFTLFEGSNWDQDDEKTILVDISKALRFAVGTRLEKEGYNYFVATGTGTLSKHPDWKILTFGQGGNTVAWHKKHFIFLDRTRPVVADWTLPLLVNLKAHNANHDSGIYRLELDIVLTKYYPSAALLTELKSDKVYDDIWGRRQGSECLKQLANFLNKDENFRQAVEKAVSDFAKVTSKYDALDFEKKLSELSFKGGL